jgi:hypothetical protein
MITPSKVIAKGSNFTTTVGVSFDLIDFSATSTVKIKKKSSKVIQKGVLTNGMSIKDYLRSVGANPVLVSFTNDNQAVTTLRFTP